MNNERSGSKDRSMFVRYEHCKTDIGRRGIGEDANDGLDRVCNHYHDLLKIAALDRLNVDILSGNFATVRHEMLPVADLLRAIVSLDESRKVRLLLWRRWDPSLVAPELIELLEEHPDRVELRTSNDDSCAADVNHFILAYNDDFTRLLLRFEDRHSPAEKKNFPAFLSFALDSTKMSEDFLRRWQPQDTDPKFEDLTASKVVRRLKATFDDFWNRASVVKVLRTAASAAPRALSSLQFG